MGDSGQNSAIVSAPSQEGDSQNSVLDQQAEAYVKLVLAVGCHQSDYVDAYYGPANWRSQQRKLPLSLLLQTGKTIGVQLAVLSQQPLSRLQTQRLSFLQIQLDSVMFYIEQLQGKQVSFRQESAGLYDALAPECQLSDFAVTLAKLDKLVPGSGDLRQRFEAYRAQFIVPSQAVPELFNACVEQARKLTRQHISLPETESFKIEYVTDQIWTAYNWYQGQYKSVIQLNQDQPLYLERALELASHEGYPGHHVFNLLQEQSLVKQKGWIEYAIYPLFSPISFLSEGSANYALAMIMTAEQRLQFEHHVLLPIAGISADIKHYHKVMAVYKQLAYLENYVCQKLTDGYIDVATAETLLVRYGLYSDSRAAQRVRFYQANRAYVINYNFGEQSVEKWVIEQQKQGVGRWQAFEALLSGPLSASQIIAGISR
ncbi:hypothetical protein [Shewanella waksmanii]|uniref:hypothetical protein n=1 Tax=Shewanella waksmanii TaxID=213783 RepID=UPI003737022A